jgi:hypothetical protein
MKFIEKLIENTELKESKLYAAAQKCFAKPDTGITIQHKGAYNVIKDCANVTIRYLPHYIFGAYANPFETLKGKFTKLEIEEFVKKSRDDYALGQLLFIILNKFKSQNSPKTSKKVEVIPPNDLGTSDPYGMYGTEEEEVEDNFRIDQMGDVEMLCLAFGVS